MHLSRVGQGFPALRIERSRRKTGPRRVDFVRVRPTSPSPKDSPQRRKGAKMTAPETRAQVSSPMLVARCARSSLKAMRAALVDRRAIFAPLRLCGKSFAAATAHAAARLAPVQSSRCQRADCASLHPKAARVKRDVWGTLRPLSLPLLPTDGVESGLRSPKNDLVSSVRAMECRSAASGDLC